MNRLNPLPEKGLVRVIVYAAAERNRARLERYVRSQGIAKTKVEARSRKRAFSFETDSTKAIFLLTEMRVMFPRAYESGEMNDRAVAPPVAWSVDIERLGKENYRVMFVVGVQGFTLCHDQGAEALVRCEFFQRMFRRAMRNAGCPLPSSAKMISCRDKVVRSKPRQKAGTKR